MKTEKILTKKIKELDRYKSLLVSRSEKGKEEVLDNIKETLEDIELILEDFNYIKSNEEETEVMVESEYRTYSTFSEMEDEL